MSGTRYIRDPLTGAVFLKDSQAITEFVTKKTAQEQIDLLRAEINTMKQELTELKQRINRQNKSD